MVQTPDLFHGQHADHCSYSCNIFIIDDLVLYSVSYEFVKLSLQLVFSVSFSTVVYALTDQPFEFDRFLKYTLIYILLNIIGDAMGLIIGALLDPIVRIWF